MKFFIAALVFFLAIGLTLKSVAAEKSPEHSQVQEDHEEKLSEKMNSFFPPKQKNPALADVPVIVKLTSPKFLSKISGGSVKLEWSAVEGATNYHVQVATDPNFKWLVANDYWVKSNSFEATKLEADKTYYWRVASVNNQNDSMFTKSLFVSSAFSTTP